MYCFLLFISLGAIPLCEFFLVPKIIREGIDIFTWRRFKACATESKLKKNKSIHLYLLSLQGCQIGRAA